MTLRPSRTTLLGAALAASLLASPAAAQTVTEALATATFDSAWSRVHATHFDTTFNGVDWPAVRDELRPRAAAARTPEQLRAVIREMLGRLRQSHFYLIPAEADRALASAEDAPAGGDGDVGMTLRAVDGRFLVTRVAPGGGAARAGVQPGWTVEEIDGRAAAPVLRALAEALAAGGDPRSLETQAAAGFAAWTAGAPGTAVSARFADGAGRAVTLELARAPEPGTATRFGNLPPMRAHLESARVAGPGGVRAGVIRFNLWMPVLARPFDEALDGLRDADGIVVDLRGNPGGVGGLVMGMAGHFTERRDTLGLLVTRDNRLAFVANPRLVDTNARPVRPYAGPVAILVDPGSASTSEIFAGGMQALGRARVFGETSQGAALPSLMARLPNGDVMVHAYADFRDRAERSWEGRGVVPDVAAPPARDALLAGGDPALDAALAWIAEQTRAGATAPRGTPAAGAAAVPSLQETP